MACVSESHHVTTVQGLTVESVEWLPSGGDAGLVRVRGRWADPDARVPELPALCVRLGAEAQRFDSLPDARFGRDPTVWRGTYLVPAALMEVASGSLSLAWPGGREATLPAPEAGFEPPSTLPLRPEVREPQGGEVIDRAVLAERRARRAEAAERAQARRAEEALKAVEVLELRSAELERRLEALRADVAADAEPRCAGRARAGATARRRPPTAPRHRDRRSWSPPSRPVRPKQHPPADDESVRAALAAALAALTKLRRAAHDQRLRLRTVELQRAADAVALATLRGDPGSIAHLREALRRRQAELEAAMERVRVAEAEVAESRRQAAEQVAAAQRRAAADAAAVRERAHGETAAARAETAEARRGLAAASEALERERSAHGETTERLVAREAELSAIAAELAAVRAELEEVRDGATGRAHELEQRLAVLEEELTAERAGRLDASAELAAARTRLAAAEAGLRAETVARAALEEELDRERTAREALSAALDRAEAALAGRSEGLSAAETRGGSAGDLEGRLAALEGTLATERDARAAAEAAFEATLAAERDARAAAEAALAAAGAAATAEAGALQARITELERTASAADLARHAAEQAAAAAAASPPEREPDRVSADLDAAAAALRARAASPGDVDQQPAEAETVSPDDVDPQPAEAAMVTRVTSISSRRGGDGSPGDADPPPVPTAVDGHAQVGVGVAAAPANLVSPSRPRGAARRPVAAPGDGAHGARRPGVGRAAAPRAGAGPARRRRAAAGLRPHDPRHRHLRRDAGTDDGDPPPDRVAAASPAGRVPRLRRSRGARRAGGRRGHALGTVAWARPGARASARGGRRRGRAPKHATSASPPPSAQARCSRPTSSSAPSPTSSSRSGRAATGSPSRSRSPAPRRRRCTSWSATARA